MSSVRDRIEREQRSQQETPAPMRPRSPLTTAAITASTRERDRAAAFQTAEPEVLPKLGPEAGGRTANQSFNGSVRDRLNKQRYLEEENREHPDPRAAAHHFLDEHYREEAEQKERELEAQRLQNERIAKDQAIEQSNLRNWNINLAFSQAPGGPPSADERRRVLAALQKFPDANPAVKVVSILLTLRGAI
jgi:hypothetical protein